MTTTTETRPAKSELLVKLQGEAEQKLNFRVSLEADLDAARTRLAAAETATLDATGKALETAIADRIRERELIAILGDRIARADAAHHEAGNRASQEARRLAIAQLEADGAKHAKAIEEADAALEAAIGGVATAIEARNLAVEAAAQHNKGAAAYAVAAVVAPSTRDVLARLAQVGVLRVEVVRG